MVSKHDLTVKYLLIINHDLEKPVASTHETNVNSVTFPLSASITVGRMFAGRFWGPLRVTFAAVTLLSTIWLFSKLGKLESLNQSVPYPLTYVNNGNAESVLEPDGSLKASDLLITKELQNVYEWYKKNCYAGEPGILTRSIPDIYKKLNLLKVSDNAECKLMWNIFDGILKIEEIDAPMVLSEKFQLEVKGWLNNNDKLFQQINNQRIYKVLNKYTHEETVFNPIRSKRPTSKSSEDPLSYIKTLSESTLHSCNFCEYRDYTAADVFGRIENEFSASCSNIFKLAKFHGIFFPKQHSPINLDLHVLQDLFLHTSKEWFEKAHNFDTRQRFPSLFWDCLPHGGASQFHPHAHGLLDPNQYAGAFESWHQISLQYYQRLRRSYWSDFVKVHFALGLGMVKGQAVVITPLTARKDNEFMILAPQLNEDVVSLIHDVLEAYNNRLEVYCFSCGAVFPKMGDNDGDMNTNGATGMPVIFRIGSRGTCTSIASDVSSLELYLLNNINSDLDKTFNSLFPVSDQDMHMV